MFNRAVLKVTNAKPHHSQLPEQRKLLHQSLDKKGLRIIALSDSIFANCDGYATQLCYVILLRDKSRQVKCLAYASYKCRPVFKLVSNENRYAWTDYFDVAYIFKYDLNKILNKKTPIIILTGSKSLFKIMIKFTTTTIKRLMTGVCLAQEAFENEDLSNDGWNKPIEDVADELTKQKRCETLHKLLDTGLP